MPSGSRWVPPAIEVAWTDTAAVPVRRPSSLNTVRRWRESQRTPGEAAGERCETWLTARAGRPSTRRRMTVAEVCVLCSIATADAKAYLSSREAQQVSESELERELDRRGQESRCAGSCKDTARWNAPRGTERGTSSRRSGRGGRRCRALAAASAGTPPGDDLRDGAGCGAHRCPGGQRRRGSRRSMAPRRSSTARAPPSTLRCGNRPHPAWPSTSSALVRRRCLCSIATGGVSEGAVTRGSPNGTIPGVRYGPRP